MEHVGIGVLLLRRAHLAERLVVMAMINVKEEQIQLRVMEKQQLAVEVVQMNDSL